MKREEAEVVFNYLVAGMGETLVPGEAPVWISEIESLDADAAMKVATMIVRTHPRMPKIAEFRRAVLSETAAVVDPARLPAEEEPAEWTYVWSWARWLRDPPEERPLPQQHPHHQPPYLTADEYAALRQEWADVGAPRSILLPGIPR